MVNCQLIESMSVVAAFRAIYLISRAFGIFPYELVEAKEFHLSDSILCHGRCMLGFLFIIRLIIGSLDLKYNLYSATRRLMTYFRAGNTSLLHIITLTVYRSVLKFSRPTCDWLNTINKLYTCMQGNANFVLSSNRFLIYYSIIFFWTTNFLTLISLMVNGKLLNGWIAYTDSMCFVFFLLIQNLYLCQFLTFVRLVALCFERINELLREDQDKCEDKEALLKKLKDLRAHHLTVTEFFEFLNSAFQLNMLIYITWAFFSTVFCCVNIVIFDINDSITLLLWSSYHPCQNLPVLYYIESVYSESNKSINLVNEIVLLNNDPEIQEETEIFSLQLQHRPTNFSVSGFFRLDYRLIYSITGVVTTYIIALIQIQPTVNDTNSTVTEQL